MSSLNRIKAKLGPKMKTGFPLVELMIVVAILAAIVIPEFQSHSREDKETAAKLKKYLDLLEYQKSKQKK